jgi:RNA polymerase sigma-70 factor (ECF subfamily)
MVTDGELMARMAAGEQSAVELLFVRWEGRLFAYFHRLGCHPSWVEDLVEETLVTLYRRRTRYDPARPFPPWLYGIARLVWKDHLRHRGRDLYGATSLAEVEEAPAPDLDALGTAERHEEEALVRRAIQRLPVEQREAFILRHYHGLSYDEIARVVGAPLGTIKWRIHEAVRRLEAALARRDVKESAE